MTKKGTAVVLGGTSNQSFAMGTFLINLKKHAPNLADEIVIFHDGKFPEKDKKIISEIFPTRFIAYDCPIDNANTTCNSSIFYFSKMVFFKYECLRLLDEYKTVICIDHDLTLLDNIQEITEPSDIGLRLLMWDRNQPPSSANWNEDYLPSITTDDETSVYCLAKSFSKPITDYDMNGARMTASLMVFHDNLKDYQKKYDFCCQKTKQYIENILMPEEAIFGLMFQEFNLNPDKLNQDIYNCHPKYQHLYPDAKILHCYTQPKFWNGLKNEQWEEDYAQWRRLGGSKHLCFGSLPSKLFRKIRKFIYFLTGRTAQGIPRLRRWKHKRQEKRNAQINKELG